MDRLINVLMDFFGSLIIFYLIFAIGSYGLMLLFACTRMRKQYLLNKMDTDEEYIDSFYTKPVSILVPVYNEEEGVVDSVHSLLSLHYPDVEIIIINDGSTDNTQQLLIHYFHMTPIQKVLRPHLPTKRVVAVYQSAVHPNLWLLDKENGGKADALNAGMNMSKYPYVCSLDGDSILESTALLRLMKPVMLSGGEVIAAGGNIRAANGVHVSMGAVLNTQLSERPLVVMQVVEYMRAFLMGRTALSRFNLVLIISGAFSVFSKEWAMKVGGYSTNTIGEDMELIVKLHRIIREEKAKKRIEFVPDPVCWTEVPQTKEQLRTQRRRWHQGLMESLWKHRVMSFNPKYGMIGMVSFPYFWLVECFGPVIELGGYLYVLVAFFLGEIYIESAVLLLLLFILYSTILSIMTIFLEAWSTNNYPSFRDIVRLTALSMTEMLWYRPLTLFWRSEGLWRFIRKKQEWGKMKRVGISKKEPDQK